MPTDLPVVIGVQLDGRVLLFSFFAALLSALFFGLAPAIAKRQDGTGSSPEDLRKALPASVAP